MAKTAYRSGDGALVAAGAGQIVVYLVEVSCSESATITLTSTDGETPSTLRTFHVPASTTIQLGTGNEAGPPVCVTESGEALNVSASTGTLLVQCAYTRR